MEPGQAGATPAERAARATAPPALGASRPSAPAAGDIAASLPQRIGVVTHYYGRPHAAVVRVEAGALERGDTIHIHGHTTDFYQRVEHLERDHGLVERAVAGEEVAVQVSQRVREHDVVFRLSGP